MSIDRINYKHQWDKLIFDICREMVKIDELPEKMVEDEWVKSTLIAVLKRMCALHKLHPRFQKPMELTRTLFTED